MGGINIGSQELNRAMSNKRDLSVDANTRSKKNMNINEIINGPGSGIMKKKSSQSILTQQAIELNPIESETPVA